MDAELAEAIGNLPITDTLSRSLVRALNYAREQSHAEVSLEHLLLALTEDTDALQIFERTGIDIDRLKSEVSQHLGLIDDRVAANLEQAPVISDELRRVLKGAAAATRGRRFKVDGKIVLAAIAGDAKSASAHMLSAQGLTFEAAIEALQVTNEPETSRPDGRPPAGPAPSAPAPPPPLPSEPSQTPAGPGGNIPEREAFIDRARTRARERRDTEASHRQTAPTTEPQNRSSGDSRAMEQPGSPVPDHDNRQQSGEEPSVTPSARNIYGRLHDAETRPQQARQPAHRPVPPADLPDDVRRPQPQRAPPPPGFRPIPPAHVQQPRERPEPPAQATPAQRPYPQQSMPYPTFPDAENQAPKRSHSYPQSYPANSPAPAAPQHPIQSRPSSGAGERIGEHELSGFIPPRMTSGEATQIEIALPTSKLKGLFPPGVVFAAVTLRLSGANKNFFVEPAVTETQWANWSQHANTSAPIIWRWTVTPKSRGQYRLQVALSARAVHAEGLSQELRLTQQAADVQVRSPAKRIAGTAINLAAAMFLGAAIMFFASTFGPAILTALGFGR